MLSRLVNPLLAPLRRWVPPIGGLDLTPMLMLLLLQIGVMLLH
jgi:YggT family protein